MAKRDSIFCFKKVGGDVCVRNARHAGPHVTQQQLRAAFELVQNKENWKMPVKAVLKPVPSAATLALIEEAVIHFTGSMAEIRIAGGKAYVNAVGYYVAIGA